MQGARLPPLKNLAFSTLPTGSVGDLQVVKQIIVDASRSAPKEEEAFFDSTWSSLSPGKQTRETYFLIRKFSFKKRRTVGQHALSGNGLFLFQPLSWSWSQEQTKKVERWEHGKNKRRSLGTRGA